jgi:phenylalanyl-tRNA synthetase beta chain
VPLSWLKDYVDLTVPVDELAHRLTMAGLEVAAIERIGAGWDRDKIVVGEILEVKPHPNADRLTLAVVDFGAAEPLIVVTGAPNLYPYVGRPRPGLKAPFARVGATLIDGHADDGRRLTLKPTRIRGVTSEGMVCSEKELGLSDDHVGIMLLDPDAPVGMPLQDYLGDTVFDIDVTPNLARALSIVGVAREVAALTGQKLRPPSTEMLADGVPIEDRVSIHIEDPDLCSRYSATLIEGVKIGPSPRRLQRRLTLVGQRPINNIVDITNYVMFELGQPLHAFDYDKLVERAGGRAPTIIVRRARPGEHLTTLDGQDRALEPEMLMIADTAGSIAIGGIMGGLDTEVTGATTRILLEAANFYFINNRRTAQVLKLPSQATARFGRGVDPELTVPAARRASELMRTLAGGSIARGVADVYPVRPPVKRIRLTTAEVRRILSMDVPAEQIRSILEALEFGVEPEDPSPEFMVTVPSHRLDVTIAADLIEEIARVVGYEHIPETLLRDELPPQRRNLELEGEERVRDVLAGAGLQEVITYSMTTPEAEAKVYLETSLQSPVLSPQSSVLSPQSSVLSPQSSVLSPSYIRLANPISAERVVMRQTLLASLLENLALNLKYRDRVAIFEINRVYLPAGADEAALVRAAGQVRPEWAEWARQTATQLPVEPRRLGIALAGRRAPRAWLTPDDAVFDFHDLKGVIDLLLERLNVTDAILEPIQHPALHPGRAARLVVAGREIGVFGEIHPVIRERYELPAPRICLAEFDLDGLLAAESRRLYRSISRYPAVEQDVALVVDDDLPAARVHELIVVAGGEMLRRVELFDVYHGPQVPAGKKSLAYSLTFQADDRTLTDDDVARLQGKIVRRLEREIGAQLRA